MAHGAAVEDRAVAIDRETAAAASINGYDGAAANNMTRQTDTGTLPLVPVGDPSGTKTNNTKINNVDHDEGKALKIVIYGAVNAMMAIPILYGYAAIIFRSGARRALRYFGNRCTAAVHLLSGMILCCVCLFDVHL